MAKEKEEIKEEPKFKSKVKILSMSESRIGFRSLTKEGFPSLSTIEEIKTALEHIYTDNDVIASFEVKGDIYFVCKR